MIEEGLIEVHLDLSLIGKLVLDRYAGSKGVDSRGKEGAGSEGNGRTVVARGNGTEGVMSNSGRVLPARLPLSRKD